MAEKIGIQSVSDIKTSKAGREYFTVEDFEQKRYVCFIPKLNHFCQVGGEIEADLTPGKSPDDSPRIDMIYVNGKPVIQVETKSTGRSYGKSDKELAQVRQLAEAQNHSIQAQTALNRVVELVVANKIPMGNAVAYTAFLQGVRETAKEFYQLLQSLTQISEAKVIYKEIKGGKDEDKTQQTDKASTPVEQSETTGEVPSDEAGQVLPVESITNAKELMDWALSHGKEFVPSWVRKEANITPNAIITDEIAAEAYKTIKASTGWDKK